MRKATTKQAKREFSEAEISILLNYMDFANQEEIAHIQLVQSTLNLFTGLNIAIIGGVFFVIKEIEEYPLKGIALMICGALIYAISRYALIAFSSNYRRQLEAIVKKSKAEDLLGLGDSKFKGKTIWTQEALILERYKKSRENFLSSGDFIHSAESKGYTVIIKKLFYLFQIIGISFLLYGAYTLTN